MASTRKRVEDVIRAVSAGIKTTDDRWAYTYALEKMNQGRAVIARNDYLAHRNWNPSLTQYFYPEYSEDYQNNNCITRFQIPTSFISVDSSRIGLIYAGADITNKPLLGQNFYRIKSRTELNDMLNHPIMSPNNGVGIGFLLEGLTLSIVADIHVPCIGGVFDDPTALPDFNQDTDLYPVDESLFQLIQTYVVQQALAMEASQTPDTNADGATTIIPQSLAQQVNKNISRRR